MKNYTFLNAYLKGKLSEFDLCVRGSNTNQIAFEETKIVQVWVWNVFLELFLGDTDKGLIKVLFFEVS